jgi:hypothetical protein
MCFLVSESDTLFSQYGFVYRAYHLLEISIVFNKGEQMNTASLIQSHNFKNQSDDRVVLNLSKVF